MVEPRSTGASTSLALPEQRLICRVCEKQFSQYTCPRCNVRYCSLQCYKRHSLRCTESFMRDNVMEELHQMEPTDQTKRRMLDILRRFHSENETDSDKMEDSNEDDFALSQDTVKKIDEDFALSQDTVKKIDEGCDISLNDLSARERKDFLRAVASGKLSHMLRPWEPWWLKPSANSISLTNQGSQLVQSLDMPEGEALTNFRSGNDYLEENGSSDIPSGPNNPLPSVRQLTSTEPSPLLAVHLVDVIYSYCFTLRFFNGDWQSDALDAAMVCLSISPVLGQSDSPETVNEALSKCLEMACSASFRHVGGLSFGTSLFDDVASLLRLKRAALICALMDLHRLLEAATKDVKAERCRKKGQVRGQKGLNWECKRQEIRKDSSWKKLQSASRKVYFLTCWTNEQPAELWPSLAALVEADKDSVPARNSRNSVENVFKFEGHESQKTSLLIEEVL